MEDISGICSLLGYLMNVLIAPQFAIESYFFHSGSAKFYVLDRMVKIVKFMQQPSSDSYI
jgi:hypothetical protein